MTSDPASSFERRHAFLTAGPEMVTFLQRRGVALRPLPRLQRLLLEREGRPRRRARDRAGAVGRSSARRLARQAAAGPGAEPRARGDDERSPVAVALQPQHPQRSPSSARVAIRTVRRPRPTSGAADERRVAHRADARDRARPRHPGVDRGAARGPDRRGRPGRRRAHRARRSARVDPGPAGRAARRRRLRPQPGRCAREYGGDQPNEAKWSIANPGDTGEALQTAMRLGAQDRPDGRGLVAAVAPHGQVRPVDARPGPPAAPHDLRRRRRAAVRERVELVHGGRQGDVRPRQDEPRRPVLADLRRPLPQAVRAPALAAPVASRASCSRAAGSSRRGRSTTSPGCAASTPAAWPRRSSTSTSTPPRASTPTTAGASRRTTGRWATPTTRCTRASARSTSRRTTRARCVPGDIGTCGGLSPTSTPRSSTSTTSRSRACTRPATSPPR